ncbi:unnamed protein product, partial [Brachionus calyciflorus]
MSLKYFLCAFVLLILNCSIKTNHIQTIDTNSNLTLNNNHQRSKYHDVWHEVNDAIVINCSIRVNRDQHVVWHRKYDKMAVHVLTIGSETFISDLRIRPIKQIYHNTNNNNNNQDDDNYKLTWNLEIRRLKKDDTALYYCVLNSENSYGQMYKLNVLPQLKFLNKSDILVSPLDDGLKSQLSSSNRRNLINSPLILVCKYDDILSMSQSDQIKWYFNRHRIRTISQKENQSDINESEKQNANHHQYTILQNVDHTTNSTQSKLIIHNFDSKINYGKYRCAYKGLIKTVRVHTTSSSNSNSHKNDVNSRQTIELGMMSLEDRRTRSDLIQMYKILNGFETVHLVNDLNYAKEE